MEVSLSDILEIVKVLASVIGLALFFFFYFRNEKFKEAINKGLKFLPGLLALAASRVDDKKGVFDTHDALKVLSRVSARIKETIDDPANKNFSDVEDEVFEILQNELANYKNLPGVPDLDDPAIRVQVKIVFESIQRAAREDSAGDNN